LYATFSSTFASGLQNTCIMQTKPILLLLVILLASCEKDQVNITNTDKLIGYWTNPVANDTIIEYSRADALLNNCYGFGFKAGQIFVERKNAGWCGTPPVSYADFEGVWEQNDSLLIINVGYWGGTVDYQWKIISIDENCLRIFKIQEDYHN
jgi:hypothetical protein